MDKVENKSHLPGKDDDEILIWSEAAFFFFLTLKYNLTLSWL